MAQQFDMRQEPDGTWTVYDVATDLPAVVNGIPQINKDLDDADDLADLLNGLAVQSEAATKQ